MRYIEQHMDVSFKKKFKIVLNLVFVQEICSVPRKYDKRISQISSLKACLIIPINCSLRPPDALGTELLIVIVCG